MARSATVLEPLQLPRRIHTDFRRTIWMDPMSKRKISTARLFLTIAMLAGFSIFIPRLAVAAPFCIEAQGVPLQCWYYEVKECQKAAGKQHARCSANIREIKVSGIGGSFCIVDSGNRPVCAFQNRESCEAVTATRSGSICFQNSTKQSRDPYRYDRMPLQQK